MAYTIPAQTFNGQQIPETKFYGGTNYRLLLGSHPTYGDYYLEFVGVPTYAAFFGENGRLATATFCSDTSNKSVRVINDRFGKEIVTNYYPNMQATVYGKVTYTGTISFQWGSEWTPAIEINLPAPSVAYYNLSYLMLYGNYSGFAVAYDLVNCAGSSENPTAIEPNAIITPASFTPDNTNGIFTFNSGSVWIDGSGFEGAPIVFTWDPEEGSLRIGIVTSDITVHVHAYGDPYQDVDGESDIPGGDSISVPGLPGIGVVSTGMVGLYNPTVSQMQLLADYMWTDFGGTGTTTEDILKEIVQAIKRSISNPLDYVIGLNIIPSQGLSVGSSTSIRFGFVNSNVSMPRLTSQYFTVDCGSLSFDKLCGDTFLDYAPYSKFSLYLPYIGVKEMDANDFVGHTISILYHGDVVTGGVTAYVLKDGSVMYQYSGCCALTVPLNADSWGTTISGAIQIATTLVGGAALSSAGKGFSAKRAGVMAATSAADIASNPSLLSPQVMRSGAISGGAGCMASQKPFVIREAVRFHTTQGFNTISGYPSYYYKTLSTMHGFTSVLDVHLHGIPGTHQELAEIEGLLKEGVIL